MNTYPRVAGRLGSIVDLNVTFYHNGVSQAPAAIRRIDIFKGSIRPGNIVSQIEIPRPDDPLYPGPLRHIQCGSFIMPFQVPENFIPGDIYYDVWSYVGNSPVPDLTGTDELVTDLDNQAHWISEYGQFWVYDNDWVTDDGLFARKLSFEPLDRRIRRGEIRTIEINIHPVPAHAFEYNQIAAIIPNLNPTISFHTTNCEALAGMVNVPCVIGIRQGHYKSPYVIQCLVDSTNMLIGTYGYEVKMQVGTEIIVSETMHLVVE